MSDRPAHEVIKGNPQVDGPYLDDIRADQEKAYREGRMKALEFRDPVAVVEEAEPELNFENTQELTEEQLAEFEALNGGNEVPD